MALVAAGCWLHYRYRVSTDDAQVDGHIFPDIRQSLRQRAGGAGERQPAGEGRRRAGAHRSARFAGQGRSGEGRAGAGGEPGPTPRRSPCRSRATPPTAAPRGCPRRWTPTEAQAAQADAAVGQATTDLIPSPDSNLAAAEANDDKGASGPRPHASAGGQGRDLAAAVRFLYGRRQSDRSATEGRPRSREVVGTRDSHGARRGGCRAGPRAADAARNSRNPRPANSRCW